MSSFLLLTEHGDQGIPPIRSSMVYRINNDEMSDENGPIGDPSETMLPLSTSAEVTGSVTLFDTGLFDYLAEGERLTLTMTMPYNWSRWDRFKNLARRILLWPMMRYVAPLPETYEAEYPNMKVTRMQKYDDNRLTVDFVMSNE